MKRQSQSVVFARAVAQITRSLTGVPLAMVLGGLLALTVNAAEGQRSRGDSIRNPESLVSESFTPREVEFQAPQAPQAPSTVSPRSFKPESYLVYINENSSLILQQVQRLEPTAFVRQYNGRSVIQAGIFNQNSNAHKLANELESKGIDTRIVSLASGKDTDFVSNYKFYFVVIPAKQEKLAAIEDKVKQLKMGMQVSISQKAEPRTHVRVGPFLEKEQAENWKRYLKASGLRKARVYYGR